MRWRRWRNPRCWWCNGAGKWRPTNTNNPMSWLEVEDEIPCSECDGTGYARWVRRDMAMEDT